MAADLRVDPFRETNREEGVRLAEVPFNEMDLEQLNHLLHDVDDDISRQIVRRHNLIQAIRNRVDNAEKLLMISAEKFNSVINPPDCNTDEPMPSLEHSGFVSRRY